MSTLATDRGLAAALVASALGVGTVAIVQGIDRGLRELRARGLDPDRVAGEILRKVK